MNYPKYRSDGCCVQQLFESDPPEEGDGYDDIEICMSPGEARARADLLNGVSGPREGAHEGTTEENMDTEKTAAEIFMRAGFAPTRGYGAAASRGWTSGKEMEAFLDGARWMLEQMREHFDIKPKIDA